MTNLEKELERFYEFYDNAPFSRTRRVIDELLKKSNPLEVRLVKGEDDSRVYICYVPLKEKIPNINYSKTVWESEANMGNVGFYVQNLILSSNPRPKYIRILRKNKSSRLYNVYCNFNLHH